MSELKTNEASEKKVYYIPMEISREYAAAMGLDAGEVKLTVLGGRMVTCIMIPTEDERIYREVTNAMKNEMKQDERNCRCRLPGKRKNMYVLCRGNCKE